MLSPVKFVKTRSVFETIPSVTLEESPRGLPMARTWSPTISRSLSPIEAKGRGRVASSRSFRRSLSTARSAGASGQRMSAAIFSPVGSWQVTRVAPSITWKFVTTWPAGLTITPLPIEGKRWARPWLNCRVRQEMLTRAG